VYIEGVWACRVEKVLPVVAFELEAERGQNCPSWVEWRVLRESVVELWSEIVIVIHFVVVVRGSQQSINFRRPL